MAEMSLKTNSMGFHFNDSYDKLLVCAVREKDAHRSHNGKKKECFEHV